MSAPEILRLFERMLELPEEERDAFLRSVPEHRAELEGLLDRDREGSDFPRIDVPAEALGELGVTAADLPAGTRIGPFRIERTLGSGGMGRVHLAEQENPRRLVALKTLRYGLESEQAFQRFRIEAEILGRLRHPGIAQIYEAGVQHLTARGQEIELPYIAMELLEGARSIVDYAQAENLDLGARLALMVDAARSVQHAHQKGIIHRDLKPGNIVVDSDGHVRIIDFGVARAVELELGEGDAPTAAGFIPGTPAYMSPEQLELPSEELDTRVDVYALGAVLYELVCGRPSFDPRRPIAELAREITERGPERPSGRVRGLARDVEAILLTAMARDRDERYASAAAFADDIERFLRHETIEARRPTVLDQVRLFARRNRLFAASLAIGALSLAAAAAISFWFAREERRAREEADAYLQEALDTNFALAFDFAGGIANMKGSLDLRVAMLRSALAKLSRLEEEVRRDPENQAALARAYLKLGDVLGAVDQPNLGDREGAALAYDKALALLESMEGGGREFRRTWMLVEEAQGERYKAEYDREQMLVHFGRRLEYARAELADHPADDRLRIDYVRSLRDVANAYISAQKPERALELFRTAVDETSRMLERKPDDPTVRFNHATMLSGLASATLLDVGAEASVPIFGEAVARMQELRDDLPDYPAAPSGLASMQHPYTEALIRAGRFEQALDQCESGLALIDELTAADPGNHQARRWHGMLLYNLGWAYFELGAQDEQNFRIARDCFEACYDVYTTFRDEGVITSHEESFFPIIQSRLDAIAAVLAGE